MGTTGTAPAPRPEPAAAARTSRAGRDVPVAIAVGCSLGALLIVTLFTYRPLFVGVVAAAAVYGTVELVRALRRTGAHPPLPPLTVGAGAIVVLGYAAGSEAVVATLLVTVLAVLAWRVLAAPSVPATAAPGAGEAVGPVPGGVLRDVAAGAFAAGYVGFLAAFAALVAAPADGPRRVTAFIATAVASDVGGFAAGVLSGGKHKLAPAISPGKSWEGLGGSLVAGVALGVAFLTLLLHQPVWEGAVYGAVVVVCATAGDLAESALKRDIGIKDMGALLPGHGGLLDRLDSLLLTAPVAWLLLSAFAPVR